MSADEMHQLGELLAAIGVILTALVTGGIFLGKWIDKRLGVRFEANYKKILKLLAAEAMKMDMSECLTFDILLADGTVLGCPVPRNQWVEILPGVRLTQSEHQPGVSQLLMEVTGSKDMPRHAHGRIEEASLIYGEMQDLDSGREYNAGESWKIPTDICHRPAFRNALVLLRLVPALPKSTDVIPNLDGIENVVDGLTEPGLEVVA